MKILSYILPALFIVFSSWLAVRFVKRGASKKKAVILQIASVAVVMMISLFGTVSAANSESSKAVSTSVESSDVASSKASSFGIGLIAMALVTGLSGIGGGIAVASAAPAAIAATSGDSKAFGKALIFVALGESIAIYGLVIAIMIFGKLDALLS